jgi:8-oxo-dGTP pyrophosphatase MutT (NUDIX family)
MDAERALPWQLVERARAQAESGRVPVEPADAATTVLLRERPGGMQIYLLRRHLAMPFAAGMYAFPGGRVDPRDRDQAPVWSGPPPAYWAERLRCDEPTARALVCAAVRETFEESGVLLAGPSRHTVVGDTTGEDWERDRAALVARTLAFSDLLEGRRLVLRSDLLAPWAHWITPAFEPRRYDTRFFVALLPAGQRARDVSGEADAVCWLHPAAAVTAAAAGELAMLPPTYVTLQQLAAYDSAELVIAAAAERPIVTIGPDLASDGGQADLLPPPAGDPA